MKRAMIIALVLSALVLVIGNTVAKDEFEDGLITWNDVHETEPNDICEQANWIDFDDRVHCGFLSWDPPEDVVDYFRFEVLTTQRIAIWVYYTFNECGQPLDCVLFRLYNEDCSNQIGSGGGGCFEPNHTAFRTDYVLQPGIYNIMVYTLDDFSGTYHLALGSVYNVPTLSEWGMLIMGLLLLVFGTVAVVRRRKAALSRAA